MFKKYLYLGLAVALVGSLVGGGVYALKSHNQAVADARQAGVDAAELVCATEKLEAVAVATAEQERLFLEDRDAVQAQLDESRQLAQHFEQRYRDSLRYANELHKVNSQCNYTVGAVRVLNDTIRDCAKLPAAPPLSDAAARSPSVVTGEIFRERAGEWVEQYCELSKRYTLLLSRAEARTQRAGSS